MKFASKADFGEYVANAQGRAKELMSHTAGEPADLVLDGLHLNGEFHGLETPDDLAQAMVDAGKIRGARREAVGTQARQLAEEQARTKLFQDAIKGSSTRAASGEAVAARRALPDKEPMPAEQLFIGDTFQVNGHEMKVVDHPLDAETGKPFGVELDGAYGRQTVPVGKVLHIDKGSLQEAPTEGRIAASDAMV